METYNFNKCIENKRLSYNITFLFIVDTILDNLLWLGFLVIFVMLIINNHSREDTVPLVICLLLIIWLLIGLLLKNKLIIIPGKDLETNRKEMISLFSNRFTRMRLDDSNRNMLIYERKVGLFNWGRKIVIIFHNSDIYINWTTLGRHDIKSPFHAPFNYYKLSKIKSRLQKTNTN